MEVQGCDLCVRDKDISGCWQGVQKGVGDVLDEVEPDVDGLLAHDRYLLYCHRGHGGRAESTGCTDDRLLSGGKSVLARRKSIYDLFPNREWWLL